MSRTTLVTMSPRALEAMAKRFFELGFACSGVRFHGERLEAMAKDPACPPRMVAAIRSLLRTEFYRRWNGRKRA